MSRFPFLRWSSHFLTAAVLVPALILGSQFYALAAKPPRGMTVTMLATGLEGAAGSTVGPDGALYVTEGLAGRISRIDPRTGSKTTFTSGLPAVDPFWSPGGPIDIAFDGCTAYVLVTLVAEDVGGNDVVGLYRVDGLEEYTIIADIGAWSMANLPETPFELLTGAQWAIEPYQDGFLVTDAHHNRVLWVSLLGEIREMATFENVAPTGLAVRGNNVFMAQAGPIPHLPFDGQVLMFGPKRAPTLVAAGVPLLVDVEFGPDKTLYALSQGDWDGAFPGSPALPNTGSLVRVNANGSFSTIVDKLDRPTSLEFIGNKAYVVTLTGTVLQIEDRR